MKRTVVPMIAAILTLVVIAVPACNCGNAGAIGTTCQSNRDCGPGLVCLNGTCQAGDAGVDAGTDAGMPHDAGQNCVGLQCQQNACLGKPPTTLVGHVYDPSGTVPLYNVVVYVPNATLQPLPQGVSCDRCGALVSGKPLVITLSGSDGSFTLSNVPSGTNIPVVYQIGKWRREVTIPAITACQQNTLTDMNLQRMPRSHTEGDIPQFAIATGAADPFQCLLYKMQIDPSEFTFPWGGGRIHMYQEDGGYALYVDGGVYNSTGMTLAGGAFAATNLYEDGGTLAKYDVVILPCEGWTFPKDSNAVANLVNYANDGGRVFATHYSYVWSQAGWPSAQSIQSGISWPPDPFYTTVETTFPKGQAFDQWLGLVGALDGGMLPISFARNDITSVNTAGGTTQWIVGFNPKNTVVTSNPNTIQHYSFNTPYGLPTLPDGGTNACGRVVFSDFHVNADTLTDFNNDFPGSCKTLAQAPFTPQERALIFMLFDVSSCIQDDAVAPSVCGGIGNACSSNANCCNELSCLDVNRQACTGATGCTCSP